MNFPGSSDTRNNNPTERPNGGREQVLSIAVLDSNFERRNAVACVLCGIRTTAMVPRVTTLAAMESLQSFSRQGFKVVLVAADGDPEAVLKTIEDISISSSAIAMAYSPKTDPELLISCMRAGVREFLTYPFEPGVVEEAFGRAESRGQLAPDTRKVEGRSFVFLGAKGGSGVTTAACNFAISMAQDSKRDTLLIDFDLPLGNAALALGIAGEYSTVDALRDPDRLDATYLSKMSTRHSSGLYVLGAPGQFFRSKVTKEAINKLIEVASKSFDYVVVDAGSRWDLAETRMFDMASTIYLITQLGIAELRNSNRLIHGCLQPYTHKLEIVLNRHKPEMFGIEVKAIEKALTRPAKWRIPNDYAAVLEMQNTAVPLALKPSGIQRAIQAMAQFASGMTLEPEKKKKFRLFGLASGV